MLSIIVPTYNEAGNLKDFIKVLRNSLGGLKYEIIIIDDNSPDGTGELAESLRETYDSIKVVHRPQKMGLASAIIDGTGIAAGDIIATLNADFQHPAEYLLTMVRFIDKFDIVIGSRYVIGASTEGWSLWRVIISKIATFLAHVFIPEVRQIKDPLSGFFALKKSVIKNSEIRPVGFKYLLEVLVKGSYNQVIEIPYIFKIRRQGKSKISFKDCFIYLGHLFSLMK